LLIASANIRPFFGSQNFFKAFLRIILN